jgi:CHAT domain-containing protein
LKHLTPSSTHQPGPRPQRHFSATPGIGCLVTAAVWLGALSAHAAPLIAEVGQEIALGNNLNDEACRLRRTPSPTANKDPARQDFGVFCEGWTQSSGFLTVFTVGPAFKPTDHLTKSGYAEQMATRLADCAPAAASKIADRLPAAVRFCKRADGGWPVVAGAASADGRGYVFEMLPTNVPLAERAVDALSTNKGVVIKRAPRTALIQQYEAAMKISATQFGVGDLGAVRTLTRLGEEEWWANRQTEAQRAWAKLLEVQERAFGAQHPANGRALAWLALTAFRQGRLPEADELFKRAEPLVRRSGRPDDLPEWMSYRSYLEHRLGHDDLAIALARQALDLRRGLAKQAAARQGANATPYAFALAHSALVMARQYNGTGRFKEAIPVLEEGVEEYRRAFGQTHPMIGWTHFEQAISYLGANDLPHAREAAAKALAMHDLLYGDGDAVFQDAILAGRIAAREQRGEEALGHFRRAVHIAQATSQVGLRPMEWLSNYMDLLAAGSGGPAEAFGAAQLVRGGVTDEAIRAMAARAAADQPEIAAVIRALQDAGARMADLRRRIANGMQKKPEEPEAQEVPRLKTELGQAEAEAAAAEQRLQAQFPQYARLVRPSQVSVDALGELLHPEEALLLAVSTPPSTYVFVVRNGAVRAHKAAIKFSELAAQISALRRTLDAETGLKPFDSAGAQRLYEILLAPVADALAGAKHLVFVSNGPLLSLPLGVLMRTPAQPGGAATYLARDFAISVVPTVGAFRDLRQAAAAAPAPLPFIGFGDPDFVGSPGDLRSLASLTKGCRADKAIDLDEIRVLPRLPETATELRGIAATLKAAPESVVLGAAATKAELRGQNLAQYRVIAFATHGLLANELDCQDEPALALSLPPKATKGSEALLTASEIVSLRLNADWILLSACNTAGPEGLTGEALSGLTRAFFYAGARSVMATHWPVESTATVRLTTLTFESFAKQPTRGKASALRDAQIALMDDPKTAHPIFWAPFVLVGDGSGM